MKKLFTFLLALIASVGVINAQSGTCGDNLTWELNTETGILIISGTGAMADYILDIPWYEYRSSIQSVIITDGVTTIGDNAFFDCSSLTSVTIPNSVTSIGNQAFNYCNGLTSVTIPNSVTSMGNYPFAYCSGLTNIVVEDGNPKYDSRENCNAIIETLYDDIVAGCRNTIIPSSVKSLQTEAFEGCSGLTAIEIPNGVTSMGHGVFRDCTGLTSITIPNSVTSIGVGVISGCYGLTNIVVEDGNSWYDSRDSCNAIIETASNTLVAGCQNTTIPYSITSIGYEAFAYCSSLTSVTIPNSITSIGGWAFSDCTGLTSVTIPNSVTSIGDNAFGGCSGLTSLTCEATTPPTLDRGVFNNVDKSIPLYVPCASIEAYKAADGWSEFTNIQAINPDDCGPCLLASGSCGEGVTWEISCEGVLTISGTGSIGYSTPWYAYRSSIKEIILSEGITELKLLCFYNYVNLTNISIPNSMLNIGPKAFQGCLNLRAISIPGNEESGTTIDTQAFAGCTNLTTVTLGNVISILGVAFEGCTGLFSIDIPQSVTELSFSAFWGCSNLTDINVASDNPNYCSIDGVLFNSDTTSIIIHPIGKLGAYSIPCSVTTIGTCAFAGCVNLTAVSVPSSVTHINSEAFKGCSGLNSITIPENVNHIGTNAFQGCSQFSSVTSMAIVPPVLEWDSKYNSGVFDTIDKSIPVYVPAESIDAYKAAIGWKDFTNILPIKCITASGYCGADSTNLTWELSCDSVLTISGTGAMEDGECIDDPLGDLPIPDEDNDNSSVIVSDPVKSIIIKEGVTTIGVSAFWGRSSLTSVTIPNTVTSIGNGAFRSCTSLSSVYITDIAAWCRISTTGKDLSGMGINECELSNPFHYADNLYLNGELVTDLVIPNSVTRIEPHVFNSCSCLTSVTIGDSVNSIGDFAFAYCKGLTSVTFGNSVTSIGWQAFDGCESLTSVTIPSSVTSIGDFAFYNCSSLTSVTFEGRTPPLMEYAFYVNDNCSFYVPCGTKDAYVAALNVNNTIDESRVIEIVIASGYCGADSTNLTWELSCDSVLTISGTGAMADYAYASITPWYGHRSAIKTILINDGVTSIGDNAFYGCKSLTSVTIGNSVTSIGNSAFSDCWRLDALQLPESVTSIGNSAFAGCFRFRNIHIPKNVSSIGTCLFQYCSKLVSITVDTENPIYDSRDNCNAIIETSTNVLVEGSNATHIPETVVAIGKSAFANKNGFRQIDIPNSITSIGEDAFINCDTLESLVVPTSVSYMGRSAFYQCSGLKTVEFKSVTPPNIDNRYMGGTCFLGTTCDFLVPCGTKEAYVIALNYQSVSDSIDESRVIESEELMFDYTISSDNTLGSVTITQEPTCTAPLIFRADAAEGYQFAQWSDGNTDNPRSLILTQDTTIKAEFELCSYTVTWLNYDSLVLELDTNVAYGTMPSYDSAVPAKPSTAEYTYTFAGWSPVVESVTGNTTYIAVFDEVLNAYTVTWLNYDSLVLELDTNVIYGTMPSYDSAVPAKPSTAEYTYTFAGWSPEVVATTEDATYTATYTSALRTYSVLVYGMNDNIILNGTYPYGESILVEAIPEQNYQFAQWSDGNTDNPRSLILTQDTILKALFEQIIIEQDTIIVTDSTDISDIITGGQDTIPHVEVQPGGEITIDRDDIGIGVITIITIGTESGQVHPWDGGYDNLKNTRVVMEYVLEPLKQQADPNKWYAFAVPFEVDIETGVTRKYGNKSHVPGKDFMILEYDSELRSKTGKGWVEKKSGSLTPGHIYMLGIEGNCNRWLFEKKRGAAIVGDKEKDLQHYAHGNSKNDGWHGLGNTTLEYVDMSFDGLNATYVYTYDNQYGRYNIYSIEELILAVGQPFFTQGDNDGSVAFTPNNGKGKGNGKKNMPIYAPSYDVQPSHPRVLLTIETEKINATPDRLYITLHDDNQCGSYRIGRDFMRMDKGSKQVPNFWCPMADGTQLSAHGVTMPTTYTTIPLGIFTPAKGEYTINAHMQDMDDYIVELYYQNVCLGIVMQGVPFRLEMAAGTSYEYSIRISRRVSTDLNPAEDTQCDKDNKWYDVLGRPLPQDAHGIFIRKGEKIIK